MKNEAFITAWGWERARLEKGHFESISGDGRTEEFLHWLSCARCQKGAQLGNGGEHSSMSQSKIWSTHWLAGDKEWSETQLIGTVQSCSHALSCWPGGTELPWAVSAHTQRWGDTNAGSYPVSKYGLVFTSILWTSLFAFSDMETLHSDWSMAACSQAYISLQPLLQALCCATSVEEQMQYLLCTCN